MTKQKKKRNKVYKGADAALTHPIVTRISAANRNKASQWWFDRKSFLRPILITSLVVICRRLATVRAGPRGERSVTSRAADENQRYYRAPRPMQK